MEVSPKTVAFSWRALAPGDGPEVGVDPDYIDRLMDVGILRPRAGDSFSPGDARRARWIQSLARAGVPLQRMAAAARDGSVSFSFPGCRRVRPVQRAEQHNLPRTE
jgi:hypothetical protein